MMNFILSRFSYILSTALFVLAASLKSPSIAYAAVLVIGFELAKGIFEAKVVSSRPSAISEDLKRATQDLTARLTALEYREKSRGF